VYQDTDRLCRTKARPETVPPGATILARMDPEGERCEVPSGASFTSPIPARSTPCRCDDRACSKDNLQQSGGYMMKTIYKAFGYDSRGDNRRTALFAARSDAEKVSRELDVSGRVVVGEIVLFESYDDWHNNQSARTE